MKTIYSLPILLILFITACERDTVVPLPVHQSKLVIYSILNEGSLAKVYVGRSLDLKTQITEENFLVKDAQVQLFADGQLLGDLQYEEKNIRDTNFWGEVTELTSGVYTQENLSVSGGKTYEIKVNHKDFEDISVSTPVGIRPVISNVRVEQNVATTRDAEGYTTAQSLIHLDIQQAAGHGNFYRLGLRTQEEFSDPDFGTETYEAFYLSEGVAIKEGNAYKAEDPWLSGKGKEGQSLKVSFLIDLGTFEEGEGVFEKTLKEAELILYSANEDGQRFMDTFKRQLESEELADVPIFPRESVVVFSNVKNGYGFAGEISRIIHQIR